MRTETTINGNDILLAVGAEIPGCNDRVEVAGVVLPMRMMRLCRGGSGCRLLFWGNIAMLCLVRVVVVCVCCAVLGPLHASAQSLAQHAGAEPHAIYASRPIGALGVETGLPEGQLPTDYAARHEAFFTPNQTSVRNHWPLQTRCWAASAMRHRPLYFEEVNAERYGYTCSRVFQPVISTAHFFGTAPYLPYLMAADCPRQCVYTLGHYRPGSCVPRRAHAWPVSVRGAGTEAAVVVGMIALFP